MCALLALLAALYNDYADEDIPDVDTSEYLTTNEEPAAELSVPPSPCPVPPPYIPNSSEQHAADFLSTVTNVIYFIPKLIHSFSVSI